MGLNLGTKRMPKNAMTFINKRRTREHVESWLVNRDWDTGLKKHLELVPCKADEAFEVPETGRTAALEKLLGFENVI